MNVRNDKSCNELREWTRRQFLRRGTTLAAGTAAATSFMPRVAYSAGGGPDRDVLVYILNRGGMDGLTVVPPYGDGDLYLARPTLAVQPPGQTNGATDLDGFFGLGPAASPLLPAYLNGDLAFIHASGSTDPTRSHFEAFRHLELGIPNQPLIGVDNGWLARHLQGVSPLGNGEFRAAALVDIMPKTLLGGPAALPIPDLSNFRFPGFAGTAELRKQLISEMYAPAIEPLGSAALDTLSTIELLDTIDFTGYVPAGGALYPESPLGIGLQQTAALIKADVGAEAIMLEKDGWDLHNELGPFDGDMFGLVTDLVSSLMAFYTDMALHLNKVTVVVMSEFGRRVAENASLGADHGHGNVMMVLGGNVNGGQVIANWPGLDEPNLDSGDLAITTDYRDVLAEILEKRLGNTDLASVFPNHTPTFPGVIV